MIKRPKRGETEEDILRMQEEYLAEKTRNPAIKPASKIVRMERAPKKSLFAKSREKPLLANTMSDDTASIDSMAHVESSMELFDDFHEKIVGATQSSSITDIVLGDIVEKHVEKPKPYQLKQNCPGAYPIAKRTFVRDDNKQGKSIFSLSMEVDKHECPRNITPREPLEKSTPSDAFGAASFVVEDKKTAVSVHEENSEVLRKMREEDILAERRKLLDTMDPTLVALLSRRRQKMMLAKNDASMKSEALQQKNNSIEMNDSADAMDTADQESVGDIGLPPSNAAVEILERSAAEKWIHFDIIEQDKLEWMRDIAECAPLLKPAEQFEARFDWKGVLLPYSRESEKAATTDTSSSAEKDDRELYLHGEEPHRPGYTLQELFRLARSNIMQQRISAFNAMAGILNIYNQGFYDNVLELPITKIFFLLRFGFDDNSPAMLEVVSKALAYLFYNETDETLLDFVFDNPGCHWQPTLRVTAADTNSDDSKAIENLQKQMQRMQLNAAARSGAPIAARVDESEEESRTTMSDFQLAETDLIDCLLRTNILQRIYFILHTVRQDNSTVSSCLKLLIRVARSGKSEAMKIVDNDELIHCLLDNFLPGLERVDTRLATAPFYNYPQYLCLKLIRVLISQNLGIASKFISWNIVDKLQNYLYNREDIKDKLIKIQIESLRIIRCYMLLRVDDTLYKKFLAAFRYMLEWHLNHVIYEVGGPLLIRQHAAALLSAITSTPCNLEVVSTLGDTLIDCCCNWFYKATRSGVDEFSQATLLSACLNAVTWYTRKFETMERLRIFNEKYLRNFMVSEKFVKLVDSLQSSSIVLRDSPDRRSIHPALPNAGSVLLYKCGPQLIIPQSYCIFLLSALWRFLELQSSLCKQSTLIDQLIQPQITQSIIQYLKVLATGANRYLAMNFFAKSELRLIYGFLCFDGLSLYLEKSQIFQISYNFLCCLTAEYIPEIEHLFERIIFNSEYIHAKASVLRKWRLTSLELVYPHYIVVPSTELTLSMPSMQAPILPMDWPYLQLKLILQNYIGNVQQKPAVLISERDVVHMTLTFVSLLEEQNPDFVIVTPTENLMYLMITFMGPDSQFLEPGTRTLIRKHLLNFYRQRKDVTFEFDAVFEGKCRFENLYALFVDHFQAASYGDELFGSLVLVPLAQRYDNKWRRRLWSDYAAALRFLDCEENLLIGGLQSYLEPAEEEDSLLKAYAVALRTNLVRPNTVPFKIAQHHLAKFRERSTK